MLGGSAMDASNILKPLLANGSKKCIGATTFFWSIEMILQKIKHLVEDLQKLI